MAIGFNAQGDRLFATTGLPDPSSDTYTVCGWFKVRTDKGSAQYQHYFVTEDTVSGDFATNFEWEAATDGAAAVDSWESGAADYNINDLPSRAALDDWHFAAMVVSGQGVNGLTGYWSNFDSNTFISGSVDIATPASQSFNRLYFASISSGNGSGMDAIVCNGMIFDYAMTLEELRVQKWSRFPIRPGNCSHWYPCVDSASAGADFSGNGNDATVEGTLTDEQDAPISNLLFPGFGFIGADAVVTLLIQNSSHGHTADSPGLTQAHELTINDGGHAHAADNLTLSQVHILVIFDGGHAHAADNLTLSSAADLDISDGSHGHSAENIALTQVHALAVDDSSHGHSADNVTLSTAGELAIAESLHAHLADNLSLTQVHALLIESSSHSHIADVVALSQLHLLVIADADHQMTSDEVNLSTAVILDISEGLHSHQADNLTLSQVHSLAIDGAVHAHSADNLDLTQTHVLIVDDALHAHIADIVTLGDPSITPAPEAVFIIRAENRVYTIAKESRIFRIDSEDRKAEFRKP